MSIELNYDGLDEVTVTALKSEGAQKAIADAIKKAEDPLKQKRDQLLGEKRQLEAQLKEVDDLGGVEALKDLPKAKEEISKKSDAEKSLAEQVKDLQKQLNDQRTQNVNEKLSAKLSKEIRDAKGVPELLEGHVKGRIKHEVDDKGALKVTVLDKNGAPLLVDGRDATLTDLLTEFKAHPTLSRAFEAPALGGSNTKPSLQSTAGNPFAKATLNITEQGRLLKTDKPRAIQLANEAGVKIAGVNA